jgi:RimJ/RimL family protein N-acetyltransferase
MIETPRLLLRPWRIGDRQGFAAMNADPEVMYDLGGPIAQEESDAKLDRYAMAFEKSGLSRWVVEHREGGEFLGYAGVLHRPDHLIGAHFDIAWRLVRTAWSRGYATEAASAALNDAFTRAGMSEVLAYTSPDNLRSQAVMARLKLHRDPSRDFRANDERLGIWRALVWVARVV